MGCAADNLNKWSSTTQAALLAGLTVLSLQFAAAAQEQEQQEAGLDSRRALGGESPQLVESAAPGVAQARNTDFVLLNGFLVFFMQVGFVSMEAGTGRAKNVRNILLKNLVNIMLCALCWWSVGYAFAYGKSAGGFIGASQFFSDGGYSGNKPWFFSWTFALSSITITSGCLAERTHLFAYPVYTVLASILVHPVVAHWAWSPNSWLQTQVSGTCKFLDFAGGTVVHMTGGLMGLIGARMVGPRLGRFEEGASKEIPGHDVSSFSIGSFMLWFGWFGFNCGSTYLYLMGEPNPAVTSDAVSRVAVNMTLCASTAGLTVLLMNSTLNGTFDLMSCCNGLLAGLSASTANVGFITPWAACVTGLLTGAAYEGNRRLLVRFSIDDPLDSSVIHAGSGCLGCILSGFLARPTYVKQLTGTDCGGVVYGQNGGLQLGMQLLGVTVAAAWVALWSYPLFWGLARLQVLRVDQVTELAGIDNMEHGGPAYPEFTPHQSRPNS